MAVSLPSLVAMRIRLLVLPRNKSLRLARRPPPPLFRLSPAPMTARSADLLVKDTPTQRTCLGGPRASRLRWVTRRATPVRPGHQSPSCGRSGMCGAQARARVRIRARTAPQSASAWRCRPSHASSSFSIPSARLVRPPRRWQRQVVKSGGLLEDSGVDVGPSGEHVLRVAEHQDEPGTDSGPGRHPIACSASALRPWTSHEPCDIGPKGKESEFAHSASVVVDGDHLDDLGVGS